MDCIGIDADESDSHWYLGMNAGPMHDPSPVRVLSRAIHD